MVRVRIDGMGADIIGDIIGRTLRDLGINTSQWSDVSNKPSDKAMCTREANRKKASVLILEACSTKKTT
jgi:hypothetical protein